MSTLKVNNVTDLGDDAVVTAGVVAGGALPAGSILQVVNADYGVGTSKSGTTSYSDTGLSATITPSSSSNKILVIVHQTGLFKDAADIVLRLKLLRDSTDILEFENGGPADGTTGVLHAGGSGASFLDSPNTTSAVTYKTQYAGNTTGGTIAVQANDSHSTITLMEVAG